MTHRFNLLVLLALAMQAKQACGSEAVTNEALANEPVSIEPKVKLPEFTPYSVSNAAMWEQFGAGSDSLWQRSHATKEGEDKARYDGEWAIEDVTELAGVSGDKALVVKSAAHHHAISAKLEKPFDPAQGGLVFQYEVKLQQELGCGGAYTKLLTAPMSGEFSDATPYTLMFGPDKCGESKVHLIFRHRSPVTGEYTEHHLDQPPTPPIDGLSHVYTLAIHTNNSFTVSIDGTERRAGSLLADFVPPVNPPKEIADPDDKKPEDWEDDEQITDPDATQPEDWDEDAPLMIPDDNATTPEGWLVDELLLVDDPKAQKPEDWEDEEDGDWAAPQVPNPRCADVPGCGPWERPLMRNPAFVGKWHAPLIDNPRYKGQWAPRRIANPKYFDDQDLYRLSKIDAVGFELWTMQAGITFDNIYLGDSAETAARIVDDVWKPKHDSELAVSEALRPKAPPKAKPSVGQTLGLFRERLEEIFDNILGFYAAFQSIGLVSALQQERSGAFAIAMVVGALGWLGWNALIIIRFFLGLLIPASAAAPATSAADKTAAKAHADESEDAPGAEVSGSTSATAKGGAAVKRK